MQLTNFLLVLATSAAIATAQSISAQQTVANFNSITSMSNSLDSEVKKVTLLNGANTGPEVISDFQKLTQTASKAYNEMGGSSSKKRSGSGAARAALEVRASSYSAAEQKDICDAYAQVCLRLPKQGSKHPTSTISLTDLFFSFEQFSTSQQGALKDLMSKEVDLQTAMDTKKVATQLNAAKAALDKLASETQGFVPSCSASFASSQSALDSAYSKAIKAYNASLP